jgi:hypothetical protein
VRASIFSLLVLASASFVSRAAAQDEHVMVTLVSASGRTRESVEPQVAGLGAQIDGACARQGHAALAAGGEVVLHTTLTVDARGHVLASVRHIEGEVRASGPVQRWQRCVLVRLSYLRWAAGPAGTVDVDIHLPPAVAAMGGSKSVARRRRGSSR